MKKSTAVLLTGLLLLLGMSLVVSPASAQIHSGQGFLTPGALKAPEPTQSPDVDTYEINFESAVGALYTTVPRPLWDLISPLHGNITSHYGDRDGRPHYGTDIAALHGTPIVAVQYGIVTEIGEKGNYGLVLEINHGEGVITRYGHLSGYSVKEGDYVNQGDVIAFVGSTGNSSGPHLHVEIHINGFPKNPYNYLPFTS